MTVAEKECEDRMAANIQYLEHAECLQRALAASRNERKEEVQCQSVDVGVL